MREIIGVLCDLHLCEDRKSPQYAFLEMAVKRMKADGVRKVIFLGDITAYGEIQGWQAYQELMQGFEHYEVLGNSDVRDSGTLEFFRGLQKPVSFQVGSRSIYGLHTPYGEISSEDREMLKSVKQGDILFLHHYIESLQQESRVWLSDLIGDMAVTVLHGHKHAAEERMVGESRVKGLRAMDPDKAIGALPSIVYMHLDEEVIDFEEIFLTIPRQYCEETALFFGMSCVDIQEDVKYAVEHGVKYLEVRCVGSWERCDADEMLIRKWKSKCDGYLSVHMPNLSWKNGKIEGQEEWLAALDWAVSLKADSLTMHPPRAGIQEMQKNHPAWNAFLELYVTAAKRVAPTVRMGIENLHMTKMDMGNVNRGFGYNPEEVYGWICAINEALGEAKVGHVLDVGHARNNDPISQQYPISRWYTRMGHLAVAYHIHQVVRIPGGLQNHSAIEDWWGPIINYASFFYAWHQGQLAHSPVFLEVKGWKNFEKSMAAFVQMLEML